MERRDVIKYTAFFMGAALSGSTLSAIMTGCKIDTSDDWVPTFLSTTEAEFIDELGETILPKTKTPGAKDAHAVRFIDTIRPLNFSVEDNEKFKTKLTAFMEQAAAELGKDFVSVSPAKRIEWVTALDKVSYETMNANPDMADEARPFYLSLKELILVGFFRSEVAANEFFAFDPIPGRFDPCIPYEQIGKAWAI